MPCSRKVRSMILRTTCFHSKVVATYQRSRGGYSGNKGVMVEGEGPWVGLRTCQYTRESQGSGPIRVRRPRRTDRSHTHAFLSSSASSLRPKVIYFYRATFDVSPSNLLVLKLGFERKEEGRGGVSRYVGIGTRIRGNDRDKPVLFPV